MTKNELFVVLPRHAESNAPQKLGELTGTSLVLFDSAHPLLMKDELLYRVCSSEEGGTFGIGTYTHFSKSADEYMSALPFEDAYMREQLLGDYLSGKARSLQNAGLWHKASQYLLTVYLTPSLGIVHTARTAGSASVRFFGRDEYTLSDADALLFMKLPPDRIASFTLSHI